MTLGEEKMGMGVLNYICPDCKYRKYSTPITKEEYYKKFNLFSEK